MKKILLSVSLILLAATSFAQWEWEISFDNKSYLNRIVRDTISNPNCIWQIGRPNKTIFKSAYSAPNSLVTDTLNPVPPNDTSIFYLIHQRTKSIPFHYFHLRFQYMLDGDSTDFGKIEISPDTGRTWIDILKQDTTFQIRLTAPKPTLRGSTTGWEWVDVNFSEWASGYGNFPILMTADTILFRFTYITDSGTAPHDGWIIDNFVLIDYYEGVDEIQNDNLISLAPNPVFNELRVHRTRSTNNSQIQIYNYTGQRILENLNFVGETIDIRQLPNGIYTLRYSDSKNFAIKKFVVQH